MCLCVCQVNDGEELLKLQELHDQVYEQAYTWFQNLKTRFRNQILQHFGPMPEREADIQVRATFVFVPICLTSLIFSFLPSFLSSAESK